MTIRLRQCMISSTPPPHPNYFSLRRFHPLSLLHSLSLSLPLRIYHLFFNRTVGIPSYNDVREGYGLERVTTFEEITPDDTVQGLLESSYGTVDLLDAYTGALAERQSGSAVLVGPLLQVGIRKRQRGRETGWDFGVDH